MIRINDILDKITSFYPNADLDIVKQAYVYSAKVHKGQVRLSGEPYLSHPLEVAAILADMKLDCTCVAAGLLHDVIEDTHASYEEIQEIFGDDVAHIVSGVTKISKLEFNDQLKRQAESLRKMVLAMADDIRVILIKLADRVHNMNTLKYHKKEEKRKLISQETLDIYSPIAARLGIYWIKHELENLSFQHIIPDDYKNIRELVSKKKDVRDEYIKKVKSIIRTLIQDSGINGIVLGRYKQFYSIYQKMISQNLAFEEIYDLIAFRIILDTVPQCYEVLGYIHSTWQPVAKRFKDYIGTPKPNMYKSLHTTVIGPFGERMEIQIRTKDMDKVAKSGIAAHWSYKEGKSTDKDANKAYAFIQNLVENQKNLQDPNEFLENVKLDLFPDEIYVFTPTGDIKALPKGATPVDFAYSIHTEVGDCCHRAKVDRRIVTLNHKLKTGNIIEISTVKNGHPNKDWLNFVKTVKARSRIRQWIKTQDRERSIILGREMCIKSFKKKRMNYVTLSNTDKMKEAAVFFKFKNIDDLIANIGYGKITPSQIVNWFLPKNQQDKEKSTSIIDKFISKVRKKKEGSGDGILVNGLDNLLIRFGKCCQPVPGDKIIGYITNGSGISIHRTSCKNTFKMSSERHIDVQWDLQSLNIEYPVEIKIRSFDKLGLLAEIASNISTSESNILSSRTEIQSKDLVNSYFTLSVKSREHLSKIIKSLKKIKSIQNITRINEERG